MTLLLLIEARASRVATHDSASVVARLRFSEDRDAYDELHLENLGPAVARDVHLAVAYVDRSGAVVGSADLITVALMAPGPSDRQVFEPALMLKGESRVVPDLDELAGMGLSLRTILDWLDDRRHFPLVFLARRHRVTVVTDLEAYRRSVARTIRIVDRTMLSALADVRAELERARRDREDARSLATSRPPHPYIQMRIEEHRIGAMVELWKARFRWWVLRDRRPPGRD